ncbi:potential maltose permease [Pseudozyma hubeiensis SY62]|uniref:Potential maltose permease n=1 Tax=Pseudozyma hubeiensis (strain SY62) TaxID=1305764 RepID=R9PE63_PSEHS|nr:potential maltose permease [Pseudozyma hubeiensis SY62]GAC96360.1 potential maltose permease [Pseudozyma hubeiensis SY62]
MVLNWAWRDLQLCLGRTKWQRRAGRSLCRKQGTRVYGAPSKLRRQAALTDRPSGRSRCRCLALLQGLSNHTTKVLPAIAIRAGFISKATFGSRDEAVTIVIGGSRSPIGSSQGLHYLSFCLSTQTSKSSAESESCSEGAGVGRSTDDDNVEANVRLIDGYHVGAPERLTRTFPPVLFWHTRLACSLIFTSFFTPSHSESALFRSYSLRFGRRYNDIQDLNTTILRTRACDPGGRRQ